MGRYDLGLSDGDFWALTLRRLMALIDRRKAQIQIEDRRAGTIVAMMYNLKRDAKKDPKGWTWQDVFPEHKEAPRAQTDEEMLNAMMIWAARKPAQKPS